MNIYTFNHIFDKYIPLSIVIMVNSLIDYSSDANYKPNYKLSVKNNQS